MRPFSTIEFLEDIRDSTLQSYHELNLIRIQLRDEGDFDGTTHTMEMMNRVHAKYEDLQYSINAIKEACKRDFKYESQPKPAVSE